MNFRGTKRVFWSFSLWRRFLPFRGHTYIGPLRNSSQTWDSQYSKRISERNLLKTSPSSLDGLIGNIPSKHSIYPRTYLTAIICPKKKVNFSLTFPSYEKGMECSYEPATKSLLKVSFRNCWNFPTSPTYLSDCQESLKWWLWLS